MTGGVFEFAEAEEGGVPVYGCVDVGDVESYVVDYAVHGWHLRSVFNVENGGYLEFSKGVSSLNQISQLQTKSFKLIVLLILDDHLMPAIEDQPISIKDAE